MAPLPRNSQSKTKKTKSKKSSAASGRGWSGLKMEDLVDLKQNLTEKYKRTPLEFQQQAIEAQLLRKDVLVHAGTGSGKTTIAAGPHVHEKAKGMVTFMVSPLIALQEEQVSTFENEFGLKATAVNSSHGGCTEEIMTNIRKGQWQIVLISPELILSKRFVKNVLRNAEMGPKILSIVIDEAHVVSHWGSGFRKQYGSLGILRALLPKGTPFVAMSATLSPRVRKDVLAKLQYSKDFIDLSIGNDRPNVSLVVRAMHNAMNTYSDIDFVIPTGVTEPKDIKKTFIYVDQISTQTHIEERLYSRLPSSFRDLGVIRPYSALFTTEHRAAVMALFKAGVVRVLICTDAAGMGCNIPDIDVVVQWKLPASVSTFVQRAGRAARGTGRTGLAVLLVEKSVYEADLSRLTEAIAESAKKKSVRQSSTYPKASKQYATDHGLLRGGFSAASDTTQGTVDVPLDVRSIDEGLYTLVQTLVCRRKVLMTVYANKLPHPTVPCCDLCDRTLLNLTRPSAPSITQRAATLKVGMINESVRDALEDWRERVALRDFKNRMFATTGILNDSLVETLSSVGPILSLAALERVVGPQWPWFSKYGDELLTELKSLSIPPMIPKPTRSKAPKRKIDIAQLDTPHGREDTTDDVARNNKRPRAAASTHREKDPTAATPATPIAPTPPNQRQPSTLTPMPTAYPHTTAYSNYSSPYAIQVGPFTPHPSRHYSSYPTTPGNPTTQTPYLYSYSPYPQNYAPNYNYSSILPPQMPPGPSSYHVLRHPPSYPPPPPQ